MQPARDSNGVEKDRGRLLGSYCQQHRKRKDGAHYVPRIAAVEEPGRPQQERIKDDVQQIDEAERLGRDAEVPRARIDVVLTGFDGNVADSAVRIAHRERQDAAHAQRRREDGERGEQELAEDDAVDGEGAAS